MAIELPGDDLRDPAVGADVGYRGFELVAVAAGVSAGEGGGEFVECAPGGGQGLRQAALLGFVQGSASG